MLVEKEVNAIGNVSRKYNVYSNKGILSCYDFDLDVSVNGEIFKYIVEDYTHDAAHNYSNIVKANQQVKVTGTPHLRVDLDADDNLNVVKVIHAKSITNGI